MAIQKPEWFRMDPAKFLSDAQVDAMSTVELGACFRLLCRQWIDGHIPDDQRALGRLCRLDVAAMGGVWETLSQFFPIVEPGKRANRFMWVERERVIADLERKSDDGTRAARKRWAEKKAVNAKPMPRPMGHEDQPNGSPMPNPMQDQTRPEQRGSPNATGMPEACHTHYQPTEKLDTQSETPEGLTQIEYARRLLEDLGLPSTGNIVLVADAISADAKKHGLTKAESYEFIRRQALADQEEGTEISRFYWTDAKFRRASTQRKPPIPGDDLLARTMAQLEAK